MNRRDFGQWGLELTPGDFACALAALGVIGTIGNLTSLENVFRNITPQVLANYIRIISDPAFNDKDRANPRAITTCYYGAYGPRYELTRWFSARALAEAWSLFIEDLEEDNEDRDPVPDKKRVRIEVVSHGVDMRWPLEQLSRSEVGAASVYERTDQPSAEISWNWPLRVGFLPDHVSRELQTELAKHIEENKYWLKNLVELVNLGPRDDFEPSHSACDLLLIPTDLRVGLATLLQMNISIEADCVFLLGPVRERPEQLYQLSFTLRSVTHSAGVGMVYVPLEKRTTWFQEIFREISHNEPLDISLYRACRRIKAATPLLMASRQLTTFSRVTKTIDMLITRLIDIGDSGDRINIAPDEAMGFDINPGDYSPRELGELLRTNLANVEIKELADGTILPQLKFRSELGAATATTKLKRRMQALFASTPAPEPQQRWIQAQIYDLSVRGESRHLRSAMRANAPHAVVVRIGRQNDDWHATDIEFPDIQSFPDESQHELTVVLSAPQLLPEGPQTATIILPRAGDSTECKFFFHTDSVATQVEARVIILHRNRILQTALLRADVVPNPYQVEQNEIQLEVEVVARPGMSDLDLRQSFDATILFNHNNERSPGVTKLMDQYAKFSSPSDLGALIKNIDDALTGVANDPEKYEGGLDKPATVQLLRDLAEYGNGLYESIIIDQSQDNAFQRAQRIQVVTAEPDARIPIEFFYDKEVPDVNAKLCPNAIEALRKGHCQEICPTGNLQRSFVCPLGFWGMRKIIEHHLHLPEYTKESVNGDFRLQSEPVSTRDSLNVLTFGLIAASVRANKLREKSGGIDSVVEAIGQVTVTPPKYVHSWKDWTHEVTTSNPAPSMLVLLTHTSRANNNLQELEIEDGGADETRLRSAQIRAEYVRASETNPPPLVMLMGCETGAPDISFLGFVPKFRRLGAAIIVSTGATVLGYQAVPVTKEFVSVLADISKKGDSSFGDVMLAVKQKMLADGFPMVLCLMAFGDADWKLIFQP